MRVALVPATLLLFQMLKITYSPKQDLLNWLRLKNAYPSEFTLTADYPFNRRISLTERSIDTIAASLSEEKKKEFRNTAIRLERKWQSIETDEVRRIVSFLKVPYTLIYAKASLTTAYKMPYDYKDKWFMIQARKPLEWQIENIIHELFHLYQLKNDPDTTRIQLETTVKKYLGQRKLNIN